MSEFENLHQAVKEIGVVTFRAARRRMEEKGWTIEQAVSTPRNQTPDKFLVQGLCFGRLITISRAENSPKSRDVRWLCLCECGKQVIVYKKNLLNGATKSCGCYRKDRQKKWRENK